MTLDERERRSGAQHHYSYAAPEMAHGTGEDCYITKVELDIDA